MIEVLIVSPHFAPTNAPDMQRVRLLLPHFEKHGIHATVLAVAPDCVDFPQDEWLSSSLPAGSPIHRVKAFGAPLSNLPGLGSVSTRSFSALRREGNRLLRNGGFDLVYFSTTQFGTHLLGPYWKSKFEIPYLMDFQDPWVNDYYREHPDINPPGGRVKFAAADFFNRISEPRVLQECAGITSVSAAYPRQLQERYPTRVFRPWTGDDRFSAAQIPSLVAPFPVDLDELERAAQGKSSQSIFDPNDGKQHWLYAGRCGDYMETSLRGIFSAITGLRHSDPTKFESLVIHFVGTEYQTSSGPTSPVNRLAQEYSLQDLVKEDPNRIPYSEVLRCLKDADLLLVPGSNDPGYSASKIFPYLLAGTPTLAVFHEESSVVSIAREAGGAVVIPFRETDNATQIADRIALQFNGNPKSVETPLKREALVPYSADSQAARFSDFFQDCLKTLSRDREEIGLTS